MPRSFIQYLHFFINDNSRFGEISRIVNLDKDFPSEHMTPEGICKYMQASLLYKGYYWDCEDLLRRYNRA